MPLKQFLGLLSRPGGGSPGLRGLYILPLWCHPMWAQPAQIPMQRAEKHVQTPHSGILDPCDLAPKALPLLYSTVQIGWAPLTYGISTSKPSPLLLHPPRLPRHLLLINTPQTPWMLPLSSSPHYRSLMSP